MVEKDKSLQGFVDSGNVQYAPLIEFRDWLKTIRNDLSLRQGRRRSGKITVANGRLVPGPSHSKVITDESPAFSYGYRHPRPPACA